MPKLVTQFSGVRNYLLAGYGWRYAALDELAGALGKLSDTLGMYNVSGGKLPPCPVRLSDETIRMALDPSRITDQAFVRRALDSLDKSIESMEKCEASAYYMWLANNIRHHMAFALETHRKNSDLVWHDEARPFRNERRLLLCR